MNFAGVFVFTSNNINKMYTSIRFHIRSLQEEPNYIVDVYLTFLQLGG